MHARRMGGVLKPRHARIANISGRCLDAFTAPGAEVWNLLEIRVGIGDQRHHLALIDGLSAPI